MNTIKHILYRSPIAFIFWGFIAFMLFNIYAQFMCIYIMKIFKFMHTEVQGAYIGMERGSVVTSFFTVPSITLRVDIAKDVVVTSYDASMYMLQIITILSVISVLPNMRIIDKVWVSLLAVALRVLLDGPEMFVYLTESSLSAHDGRTIYGMMRSLTSQFLANGGREFITMMVLAVSTLPFYKKIIDGEK